MSNAVATLLEQARSAGVELWMEGDRLRYRAPKEARVDALLSDVKQHRDAVILALQEAESQTALRTDSNVEPHPPVILDTAPLGRPARPRRSKTKFSLFGDERLTDELPQPDESCHPYVRFVSPYKGFLFSQLEMEKRFVRGRGCLLYDEHGQEYLDFIAQFGALPFGLNPPEIWQALEAVRAEEVPSFVNPSLMDAAGALAERLLAMAPPGMRYVTFANSGAEAVEVAIKLCRAATRRIGVLATRNGFHGLTLGAMSATGNRVYHQDFGAPVPGFEHIPFGDLAALQSALAARPGYYAAFVVEPIQGEGGIVEAPAGYLAAAQEACRAAGTLFIVDEVQTGLGRTGDLFACNRDDFTPDVMTLAKALGGGLMPIGACLYGKAAYSAEFDLRHSSTFAGNTLACRAGLASLDLLERDDRALIRSVATVGAELKQQLLELQREFPEFIQSVRGRGFLLGVELELEPLRHETNLLGFLQQQNFVIHLLVGYLLNVEGVRVAPSFSSGTVIRIEPPLIAGRAECQRFLSALRRTLQVLRRRDSAQLTSFLATEKGEASRVTAAARPPRSEARVELTPPMTRIDARPEDGRFAFIVHLLSPRDLAELDPSLESLSDERLLTLKQRMIRFLDPFPIGSFAAESALGSRAVGELILIPYTAEELLELPGDQAINEISLAVEIARDRGARVVGLGGFTSIVTHGGLSLPSERMPQITSGNSFTVVAGRRAVQQASRARGLELAKATVAVVGATGMIGRALAFMLAEEVGRLILVGNPTRAQFSTTRLQGVANEIADSVRQTAATGRAPSRFTVADQLATRGTAPLTAAELQLEGDGPLAVTTSAAAALPLADIVITATNSPEAFIESQHLKRNAIICDLSRPFNICANLAVERPDVQVVEGGLVRLPGNPDFRFLGGKDRGVIVACIAETILLALEHQPAFDGLCGSLQIPTILELERLGQRHGFEVMLESGACPTVGAH